MTDRDDDTADDKRDFFRIRDSLALDVRKVSSADPEEAAFEEQSPLFSLLTDLHTLDYESQHLLRQIAERDRALAHYLKIINKRVDLVSKALALQLVAEIGEPQEVTLSEGGISFDYVEPLEIGSWLALRMVLLPSPLGLVLPSQVIRCETNPETGLWTIAVSFHALADNQRQLLARHILQKQAQEIRATKTQATLKERTPT
ncbi:PilZ domain-containing protein [Halopseudomonas sp.]|uniref:PilZ domain-containing protein n=1 Tax=Halopseudomonas sp. TaxID=2901191 RepID=UPI00356A523D